MDCEYKEKVILYFYGELPDNASAGISSHLKVCSSCADDLSVLKGLVSEFDAFRPRPPAAEPAFLSAAIADIPGRGFFHGFTLRLAAGAAAALFLAAFNIPGMHGVPSDWQSGIDAGLENLSDRIYALDDEMAYPILADFDYAYSDLEIHEENITGSMG